MSHQFRRDNCELYKPPVAKPGESPVHIDLYFWKKAFLLNPLLRDFFGPWDSEILSSLEDFGVILNSEKENYRIWLQFGKNRFFSTRIVWKDIESTLKPLKVSGINWRSGYCPLDPINLRKECPKKVTMCRAAGVHNSFLVYFMQEVDDECQVIFTSILLSIWKNPFRIGF